MKKLLPMFALMFALSSVSFAQHCPFDGYRMIVVRLTDANNKPVTNAKLDLREIDNPQADGCAHSKGLLAKPLSPVKTLLDEYFGAKLPTGNAVKRFCADCPFLGAGYYAAILTQGERFCMIYDEKNNLNSKERKIEIHYGEQTLAVESARIYRLCWAEGEWSRIQPIKMRVKAARKGE